MKDKFKEYACEFINEEECEEELEEDELNLDEEDEKHFDEEHLLYKEPYEEKDEKHFEELTERGVDEKEAAHIIDRESFKHIKENGKMKGGNIK